MPEQLAPNVLYMVVLPVIRIGEFSAVQTEQIITLFSDRALATEFFQDQVDVFIKIFEDNSRNLTGGHVLGYKCETEKTENERVIVRVTQNVA